MRYLASAFGSAGDFLPTLAVARALSRQGHHVTFVTNPFHEAQVRSAGLDYRAAGEHVDLYGRIAADPGVLTSPRAIQVLEELAGPHFAATHHLVGRLLRAEHFDAVIGSNLAFGVHWAAAERRVPAAMISATPLAMISREAAVQFLDFEIPARILPLVAGVARAIGVSFIDHALRSVARSTGATAIDASYSWLEANVAVHACMWPTLIRPPAPGDLPNLRTCGFARQGHLGTSAPALPEELEAFLARGEPPVVIALGSIFSLGADELVADAAEACAEIGRRCVVVGPAPRGRTLPDGTLVVPYATYALLFPRAAALVIHGGAGTTGEALRSGRPSVVVPFAFDQFGLSWQVQRLRAGRRLPKRERSREDLTRALREACESEELAAGAARAAAELRGAADGAEVVAELVTGLGPARRRGPKG